MLALALRLSALVLLFSSLVSFSLLFSDTLAQLVLMLSLAESLFDATSAVDLTTSEAEWLSFSYSLSLSDALTLLLLADSLALFSSDAALAFDLDTDTEPALSPSDALAMLLLVLAILSASLALSM